MKTLKTIFASIILILAIGVPVYAGDVHTPANPTPPPPPAMCSDCDETTSDEVQVASSDPVLSAQAEGFETSAFGMDILLALLSFF